jgi:hypothetical protein
LRGRMTIQLRDQDIELGPGERSASSRRESNTVLSPTKRPTCS